MAFNADAAVDSALLQKNLNGLQSEDKRKRKSALSDIRKQLFSQLPKSSCLLQENQDVFKAILRCISDESEACREAAVHILKDILVENVTMDLNLVLLMPVLSVRLGSEEVVEPSEEVRHALVELLHAVVKKASIDLLPYFNDVVTILKKTILDPFPKIKRESCECTSSLAFAIPESFHMQSESLIKPLVHILTHQQYRVRVSAILALGVVIRYGNNKSIKEVSGPLAERMFDQTPQVREAITQIIGDWLVHLPDRYSYFHIMIPLMLTSLNDPLVDIQEKAWVMWNNAGEQWIKENEDDIKDKLDFLDCTPNHYPENLRRPNMGCRTLVKRSLHKIAPVLVRELQDWLVDVRIKASQLLCVLILNAESDLQQYLEQMLLGMYRACHDEDIRVVNNIERASHLIGYFIPPSNYWSLIQPVMEDSCHQGHLRVLASIMRGTERSSLETFQMTIADFLEQPSICRSREALYQLQLVKCCEAIMFVCEKHCIKVSQQMFNILVTTLALAASDEVVKVSQDALQKLRNFEDLIEAFGLYKKFMRPLLQTVSSVPVGWTVHSPERMIFQTLMLNSGPALSDCLDVFVPTLSASLCLENEDAEMKLKLLTSLAIILQNTDENCCISSELMDPFLFSLLKGVIAPNLVWRAGRTAEALRTITVSCLLSILQTYGISHDETVAYLLDSLVPLLLALVEDASKKTRLYTCLSLCQIINAAQRMSKLNSEHVHKIYFVVMKRLDDVDDNVRKISVEILRKLFIGLPGDYNIECSSAHIEAVYSTLLIHLDDPSVEFGVLVLGVLKELSGLKPEYLLERLKVMSPNFRNQEACQDLLSHVSILSKSGAQ